MWDWILICNVLRQASTLILVFSFISLAVYLIGVKVCIEDGLDLDSWKTGSLSVVKPLMVFVIVSTLYLATANLPKIVVQSNIDRVKINYTSPQSIAKIESGALQFVNKLDKLIDKGINPIEPSDNKE